ncbi:hypothetical protein [Streptomyces vilmorinianum]|uniref:hypothetical protein n=1 Tax=Streptomyces vilmorinianum TaxID=3051092 RepID=UPI0010FB0A57|nr:hypothetical protein [Streptomyces vilmorinianum]
MAEQHDGEREPQPIDEEAAWAAIVAGYGQEPADPPGARPFRSVEDLALPEPVDESDDDSDDDSDDSARPEAAADEDGDGEEDEDGDEGPAKPALGSSIVFAPGVSVGGGPRDYQLADPDDEPGEKKPGRKGDDDGEGHFVPPEPPPLPEADATTKFAWLGVVGGPVLMLIAVLLQWDMTWWLTTLCIGGFLGGFATLVARMKHDDDDDGYDDPGRGAVV